VTPVLLELLADRVFDLRELAAWWLGYRYDNRAAPAMLARLRDVREAPAVRRAVGFAIGVLGPPGPSPR
jgi:HEAT repeat protein